MTAATSHDTEIPAHIALQSAAHTALRAPSVFNTQPWIWRLAERSAELWADPTRRLENTDPNGHLMTLSCGAALHHARTALASAGWRARVDRLPDPARPDLLARISLGGRAAVDPHAAAMAAAVSRRRTDRRAFGARQVPGDVLDALCRLAESEGAYLHVVRPDQVALLAITGELAAAAETDDPDYRAELEHWTTRTPAEADGVPSSTAVRPGLRRVPIRDFTVDCTAGLDPGSGRDRGSAYVVLFGTDKRTIDHLRGGEALSAVLLHATAAGLGTEPISDAVEVSWPRHLLRGLLAGRGEPLVVVRLGYPDSTEPLPPVPRRPADVVIRTTRHR